MEKAKRKLKRISESSDAELRRLRFVFSTIRIGKRPFFLNGDWNTIYKRFSRWDEQGVFERMMTHFSGDSEVKTLMLDSTSPVRTHVQPALKKRGVKMSRLWGVLEGGFSTKIHVLADGLGNPVKFLLTAGQLHDASFAEEMMTDQQSKDSMGDKAYDSNAFVHSLEQKGIPAVIPPRSCRNNPRDYDKELYKERS